MLFGKIFYGALLGATVACAAAIDSNLVSAASVLKRDDQTAPTCSFKPLKVTKPFVAKKATAAQYKKWDDYCHSGKTKRAVVQDGVEGNDGLVPITTNGLKTCFGVVFTGTRPKGCGITTDSALLWHMSGTIDHLNAGWKLVVEKINKAQLTDLKAYLSVPADDQPNKADWSDYKPTHLEVLAALKKVLRDNNIHFEVETRPDVTQSATMTIDGSLHITVNGHPFTPNA